MRMTKTKTVPTFELESTELSLHPGAIAGVDEAGRGPWAGPVVAAAVILDPDQIPSGIDDSKSLDESAREAIHARILKTSEVAYAIADVTRIDRDNILNATLWAMTEAAKKLNPQPRLALIDGNRIPKLNCKARTIVKGDSKCLSIAAASIVAKVTRDRIMKKLGEEYPGYGFERHKGYGTPEHRHALKMLGVTPEHRRSFRPIQLALELHGSNERTTADY